MKINYKHKMLFSFLFFVIFANNIKAETIIELETDKSIVDVEKEAIEAKNGVILKYDNMTIRSDFLKKLENENILLAYGNVVFTQGTQTIKAEQIKFNMDTKEAIIINSDGFDTDLQLRFGGTEVVSEGSKKVVIKDGWFTPSPYEKPNYKINSKEIVIYPQRKLVARNIALNVKGKDYFKFPYYVASLKKESQRATLFPYVGYDSDRGYYGIMGFDYEKGQYLQGFVDVELSSRQKLALKMSNDYTISEGNSGNIFVNRFVIPNKNAKNEWDFKWSHKFISTPKKDKADRNFYDLGYGIWGLSYENKTTNLMNTVDGDKLKDNYKDFVENNKKIGLYNIKIDQELGKNGELNLDYKWSHSEKALKKLTEINDKIAEDEDISSVNTDVDLYKKIKYTNGNSDVLIKVENENFKDINPGYVGDNYSYSDKQYYLIDFKGPKIKLELLESDNDKYEKLFNIEKRNEGHSLFDFETNNRLLKTVEYDKKYEGSITLGNYYLFRKNDYFGYKTKTLSNYLFNNFYFGFTTKYLDIRKKEYEYDYTRDNENFNDLFINNSTKRDSKIYKIYEDGDTIKRAKKIIYEKYNSEKINIGNDKIDLPFPNSYIGYEYGFETRNYSSVYVPKFFEGRKIEDNESKTKYEIEKNEKGEELKKNPKALIHTVNTKLYTTLYDNTHKVNNKYDVKVVNDANVFVQKSKVNDAKVGENDIIEAPTNALGIDNNFKFNIGNVNFHYNFSARDDKHYGDNWLKNRYVKNYFKADIDQKRYILADFNSNDEYEFKNYKNERNYNRKIEYGYTSSNNDKIVYKYNERNKRKYPYHTEYGWIRENYKELEQERKFSVGINEWGFEYTNENHRLNDIFTTDANNLPKGTPELKLKTENNNISIIYNTKNMKEKKFDADHYVKLTVGTGKKVYKNLDSRTNKQHDYVYGKDYTNIGALYKYENSVRNQKMEEVKQYFQVGLDVQLDGTNSVRKSDLKGVHKINTVAFKTETGYGDKLFASYKYIMKRPDRINRNKPEEYSKYNFRKHELEGKYVIYRQDDKEWNISGKIEYVQDGASKSSDPEIYESSYYAKKVNRITEGMISVGHKFENLEWEIGGGVKWDKPSNKKLGYYPVFMMTFRVTPFADKNARIGYREGKPTIGIGM